ncbi:MAG: NAD(P)/FAD-dependent oxidoreductase [Phenylobacterium sp.]|uniref:FAD-dependent oxidoreductase n=1 Tax=Phenylobacterium sp. TaxID=1871053 RepID=UPI00271FC1A2|nr:NAD(P)/FAD-dependent oxidoreductase [Phenylobacterium sp.]MDO9430881.1 NAD(P)/FAD-dependent oxidoreductase [Phenylobacterium sp.]
MKIAVVGCGVAGMAASLALARRGHQVVLLEAFTEPRPLGSGLLLQPSGLAALRALGLADPVIARGARVDLLDGRDLGGRPIMAMRYADWRPDAFGVGVHRATLFGVLHEALAPAGVELRTGVEIVGWESPDAPRRIDAAGGSHGPFDLVVIADGAGSKLRGLVRPRARAPVYPWGAVWANARDPQGVFAGALTQRYDRASTMMGVLPIGRGPTGDVDLVSFFWSLPVARMDEFMTGDLAAWRARAQAMWPQAAPILAQFESPEVFSRATYRDVRPGGWSNGRFLLIGDAAHGTSPQLGQGANLGLIDAVELAERLTPQVAKSVRGYQLARRRHAGLYQFISRWLTPLFQSDGWLGPFVRDWIFTPGSKAPGARQVAALVLTGTLRLGRTPKVLRP